MQVVVQYNQQYIYNPEYAAACRTANPNNQELDETIIEALSEMIADPVCCGNPIVGVYKHSHEALMEEEERQARDNVNKTAHVRLNPQMKLELVVGDDRRTQNLPTVIEIAAIIPNKYSHRCFRDIPITYRNGAANNLSSLFKRIYETHAAYMPLYYVLWYPRGEYGWHWRCRLQTPVSDVAAMDVDNEAEQKANQDKQEQGDAAEQAIQSEEEEPAEAEQQRPRERVPSERLIQRAFYRFRLHVRPGELNILLFLSRRLFQQYVIDAWAVCEQTKLDWIEANQSNLCADV